MTSAVWPPATRLERVIAATASAVVRPIVSHRDDVAVHYHEVNVGRQRQHDLDHPWSAYEQFVGWV